MPSATCICIFRRTAKLNEIFAGNLEFLQDNYFAYQDYALVGTKGFTFEDESGFTAMAEEYGVEQMVYAHSHGESRFYDSILGEKTVYSTG